MQDLRLTVLLPAALAVACTPYYLSHRPAPQETATPEIVRAFEPPPADWTRYRVRTGDTLAELSHCSGASVAELARHNSLDDPDAMTAGLELRLPPGERCSARDKIAKAPPVSAAPVDLPPRVAEPCPRVAPKKVLESSRTALRDAEERQALADFEGALARAEGCSRGLTPYVGVAAADALRARCHVMAATAAAGLERRERAVEEFRRAFAIDPKLDLPPDETSPRLRELIDTARLDSAPER